MRTLLFLLSLIFSLVSASPQVCSLYSNTVQGDVLFNYPSFTNDDTLILTSTSIVNNALRLSIQETNGGTVFYAWRKNKERIADGFITTFQFKTSNNSNHGDGFEFFIQNSETGTDDLNGGSGDKLGGFGIAKSIGVRFDMCVNRPSTCTVQQIGLQVIDQNFNSLVNVAPVNRTLADGNVHTVTVIYEGRLLGVNARLRVVFDNAIIFDTVVGDLSSSILFNSRFAFFGFTASTSWTETVNTDILSWSTTIMPSDSDVQEFTVNAGQPVSFDFGSTALLHVRIRDSCKNLVTTNINATILATMSTPDIQTDNAEPFSMTGNVTNNKDGTYTVSFNLPFSFEGSYDLDVLVNGVRAEGMVWRGGVLSVKPLPIAGGLPIWALVLLLLLILLIILVLSYIVYRLRRYQKKLKENAEFIEAGKKQAELDRLEDGTKYSANPMVGTIDDLKSSLARNEEELERLRKRGQLGEDQNFTIEQLQKQRDNLMEEMNRLKREEQEEELRKKKGESVIAAGTRAKKEFGREQI